MRSILFALALCTTAVGCSLPLDLDVHYLALGDSYTIGASVAPEMRWPTQLAGRLAAAGVDLGEVGYLAGTGWTTTRLLEALSEAALHPPYALVSVLIGVNNEYQKLDFSVFERELPLLLSRAVELTGGNRQRVFVLSIPSYTYTPFGQRGTAPRGGEIDRYNEFVERACSAEAIRYFYITDLTDQALDDPTLLASDGLHPSAKAYTLIAERILPGVLELLQK